MSSEFSNTMRAMQGAITGARAMLNDALTVERIQRSAAGHIRSEDTVLAALREVDESLKVLQDAYQQAASSFSTERPVRRSEETEKCGKDLDIWPYGACTEDVNHAGRCDRRSKRPARGTARGE